MMTQPTVFVVDDDPSVLSYGELNRGNQVGEALAYARSRFYKEMVLGFERLRHGARHLKLLRSDCVSGQLLGDKAIGSENSVVFRCGNGMYFPGRMPVMVTCGSTPEWRFPSGATRRHPSP